MKYTIWSHAEHEAKELSRKGTTSCLTIKSEDREFWLVYESNHLQLNVVLDLDMPNLQQVRFSGNILLLSPQEFFEQHPKLEYFRGSIWSKDSIVLPKLTYFLGSIYAEGTVVLAGLYGGSVDVHALACDAREASFARIMCKRYIYAKRENNNRPLITAVTRYTDGTVCANGKEYCSPEEYAEKKGQTLWKHLGFNDPWSTLPIKGARK